MIEVQNLSKRYGSQYAVRNISFQVEEGKLSVSSAPTARANPPL